MPGPIGQDYEDAATAGGSGSLNAKLRLMTTQLAALTTPTLSGTVTVNPHAVFQTAGPWAVSGTISVGNSPSVFQTAGPWAVSGTVTVNPQNVGQTAGPWAVSGTVSVGNSPNVGQTAGPWAVSGNVGGFTAVASGSFIRPTGTNTYTANTGVATVTGAANVFLTLAGAARVGGPGTGAILGAILTDYANQTTKGQFELWLFTSSPLSGVTDNANWTPAAVDLQSLVGVVGFNTAFVGNNGSGAAGNVVFVGTLNPNPMPFRLASGTSLFGMMVTRNAYVPVNSEAFGITLSVNQD